MSIIFNSMELIVDLTGNSINDCLKNICEQISLNILENQWEIIGPSKLDFPFKLKVSRNLKYELNICGTLGVL